jgi:hypothetical protein
MKHSENDCAEPIGPSCSEAVGDQLAEQVEYYRARAGEYDDWWLRCCQASTDG